MYDFETWPERHDTTSVKWKMIETELGVGHEDVLALSVADMEFVTPPAVVEALRRRVEHGIFGADMKVELLNDGPFTILLDSDTIVKKK